MEIIEKIKSNLLEAKIAEITFEGSEIIIYTRSKDFFLNCTDKIKELVNMYKKRIEVRAHKLLLMDQLETEKFIKDIVPKEAEIRDIYFEPEFSKIIIHAKKPGLVIGKNGMTLLQIKEKTFWTPEVKRTPVIESELIKRIRAMLHKEADYRKKFLHEIGKSIYLKGKDVDWVRVTFLGGAREVGRSCILIQTPESNVILDCGISVDSVNSYPFLEVPEFNLQDLDAVIISHAHLDHAGLLPFLYQHGYRGPFYCTRPTRDLATLLQLDYINVMHKSNKKSPYTSKGIELAIKHCIPLEYDEVTDITPDMRVTLANAGHLLGSAQVHLHIGEGLHNILYTGDLKFGKSKLFERASTDFVRVETLIIESTYGIEKRVPYSQAEATLIAYVKDVLSKGGKILIPSFAVGRAQEVIGILAETDIDCNIYLDGMLLDATAIHTAYPEFLNKEMQNKILHLGKNPFVDERLKGVGSQKEKEAIIESKEPCIVLATSGMLTAGPALDYLKAFANNENNALIFVGYQGEGTLGRRIQKGWKHIQFENGEELELKLKVLTVEGLSGHSDQQELSAFIKNLPKKPKKIIVNHGESSSALGFAKYVHKTLKTETTAPKNLETIRLR